MKIIGFKSKDKIAVRYNHLGHNIVSNIESEIIKFNPSIKVVL